MGKVATPPLPPRGSPPLHSGGQNQKWPTSGQGGYTTPAASGIPTASKQGGRVRVGPQVGKVATSPLPSRGCSPLQRRGAESEVAHKWARWLHHPCRLGDPHRLRPGGKIRSGPKVGKVATPPLPPRGSPPLHSGGQNHKWPTSGQGGYTTPAASGIPTASKQGGRIRIGPQVGKVATSPLPPRGSSPLQRRGAKSEVAHKWARWLHHPCCLGDPHRFKAGGKIRSSPQVGKVATPPLLPRGSPPLKSGGQNQKWPTSGQGGYITPAA